ncbi:MAG: hypothetical protein M1821_002756 [Bathelium mastoideum]|nr:MAG: hypothetical protein M1821_002756 [Bathelium mastoideum]
MYLPRPLIAHLYASLLRTHHALAAPVLLLVALDPDALCAARILTQLLKRDYIPHKIQAIAGYTDLQRAGVELVRPMRTIDGGVGGVCVCLGCGGLVDLEETLGLDGEGEAGGGFGDVQVWVLDSRRPWNLDNVFRDHVAAREVLLAGGEGEEGGALVKRTVGVEQGRVKEGYKPARGGIIVFDDGDIEEDLAKEKEAYCALEQMPEIDDAGDESDVSETEAEDEDSRTGDSRNKKRKSWDRGEDEDDDSDDDGRARRRRRSNSGSSVDATPERPRRRGLILVQAEDAGSSDESRAATPRSRSTSPQTERQPSARTLRRRLLRLRRKHESVLHAYYGLGTSYSEPVSSLLYSLASELGREDNDLLWLAIVGVSSTELYGRTLSGITANPSSSGEEISLGWNGDRGERIRSILRDEVRRLNPAPLSEVARERELASIGGVIPTHARSPTDMSIRISPEPRFLLIRHWSLYDSMLHSSYLATRLHIWSDSGQRRLHKLLAKMGVSLAQCRQSYTHMDMDLKRGLRQRLLRFAPAYGLDGLVPPADAGKEGWGFVRSWGWKASLSATDVAVVLAAILDISDATGLPGSSGTSSTFSLPTPESTPDSANTPINNYQTDTAAETATTRFWRAYDALSPNPSSHSSSTAPLAGLPLLLSHIPTAQALHRAIMRTGCALLAKRQIRPLRAFRMGVVREGPDVPLFARPGALVQLALWVAEAVRVVEGDGGEERKKGRRSGKEALVLAGLDEGRGVYVVVGLGGGGGVRAEEAKKSGGEERRKRRREREERRKEREAKREERRRKRREERGRGEEGNEEELETESEAGSSEASSQSSGSSESESEDEAQRSRKKGPIRNRFGHAFQAVAEETGSRVRIDSFEHCVVEVRKEDLSGFLEALSMKAVVG